MKTLQEIKAELPRFSFNDFIRYMQTVEESVPDGKPLKIALLRSYTAEMLMPILKFRLLLEGYHPEFFIGEYNQFIQEIIDLSSPLHRYGPDLVIILLRMEDILPDFVDEFGGKTISEWESVIESKVRQVGSLAATIERTLSAQMIFQNMCLSDRYWGVFDAQQPEGQGDLIHRFNRLMAKELRGRRAAYIWDFNRFVLNKGYETLYDPKMWLVSKNPFRLSAYPHIADDLLRYMFSALGRVKKCIVVDLDNTLWGGIAGEDGMNGIALGHDYPGICYRDFQKGLLKLYHRGIILAINSKNNEEEALEIIDKHPDMLLRREHFAAVRINWDDKAANLRALAKDLNIGMESMIFIDDNPVECELVRQQCPECEVVCLPEKVYLIPNTLCSLPGIENIKLTEEDKKKGEMYQAQIARKQYEAAFENLDDFLKSLDLEVHIDTATDFSISRISQLTQKTNQMNQTTRRYTESDIQALVNNPNTTVFSVSSKDRFGDNGIVGVIILIIQRGDCKIDTFLLSCRVIGRNIEQSMIAFIAEFAKTHGVTNLIGEYLQTPKNQVAADMYLKFGFKRSSDRLFRADLEKQTFRHPLYIRSNVESPLSQS